MIKNLNKIICLAILTNLVISSSVFAAPDVAKGKEKYNQLCLSCHGASGAGDGPVGASLPPAMKPANFQDGKYKFATDMAKFKELLQKGGAAVGLNALMPAQAGLTDDDVANLYAFVQSLKK
jgi:high-affinity iron transporter